MRILVVEDEKKLSEQLSQGLSERGFVVDRAHDGIDGRRMALAGVYDVLLLDVMLPGMDGFEVLRTVRQHKAMPILMLTARDNVEDIVRGLQAGADDYLIKPFAFPELLARIHALLRRGRYQAPAALRLDDLELDMNRHLATRAGKRIDLTAQEFKLLSLLLRMEGQVLSRTAIAEHVWDMNFNCDSNVVDVAVRRLRRKVDVPVGGKLIHTVRGIGYVLELR